MSRIAWIVCALGVLIAAPAPAEDRKPVEVKPAKKTDPTERILDALAQTVALPDNTKVGEWQLSELLQALGKRHEVNFVLNELSFKTDRGDSFAIGEQKTSAAAGTSLHQFLGAALESLNATYLVRNGAIEIVPVAHAAMIAKAKAKVDPIEGRPRLEEPLVSAIIKEKPLNEAVAKIAEMYDLSVVVGPQAADAKTGFVTARLLNVPADKALELLTLQCDLRIVRRGAAYYITSKDHATELFNEKLDKERQKIEVQKLKEAPALPPIPPAPPEKPPEKAP